MISLSNVTKSYATAQGVVTALQDINLEVERGEIFGIVGKSGAGKSTLIRCVNLLERPTSGTVRIDQEELTQMTAEELRHERRKIGMIFQHFNLLSSRTVYANVALSLELEGKNRTEIAATVMPLLELTGLQDKKNHFPSQLSGGQKQRVAIARALASQPKVLLSDEATSALDPETTTTILELLKNIRDRLQVTILLITHEMSVIKACCDRVAILEQGKLIEENEVGDFFAQPKTLTAKNFIVSAMPQVLPPTIIEHVMPTEMEGSHPILRLWFFGDAATQPVMAKLMNQFNLQINIMQANMEYIKQNSLGFMILALNGERANLAAGIHFLRELGVKVEVLGYVPNNIISFA